MISTPIAPYHEPPRSRLLVPPPAACTLCRYRFELGDYWVSNCLAVTLCTPCAVELAGIKAKGRVERGSGGQFSSQTQRRISEANLDSRAALAALSHRPKVSHETIPKYRRRHRRTRPLV